MTTILFWLIFWAIGWIITYLTIMYIVYIRIADECIGKWENEDRFITFMVSFFSWFLIAIVVILGTIIVSGMIIEKLFGRIMFPLLKKLESIAIKINAFYKKK